MLRLMKIVSPSVSAAERQGSAASPSVSTRASAEPRGRLSGPAPVAPPTHLPSFLPKLETDTASSTVKKMF